MINLLKLYRHDKFHYWISDNSVKHIYSSGLNYTEYLYVSHNILFLFKFWYFINYMLHSQSNIDSDNVLMNSDY